MTLVLVIDDEPQILRALRINLTVRGYQVITASTGAGALRAAAEHPPDVVILDLGLPDMSSIDVLGRLRGWLTAPVILSARTDSSDRSRPSMRAPTIAVTNRLEWTSFWLGCAAVVTPRPPSWAQPVIKSRFIHRRSGRQDGHRDVPKVHLTPTEWGMLEMRP